MICHNYLNYTSAPSGSASIACSSRLVSSVWDEQVASLSKGVHDTLPAFRPNLRWGKVKRFLKIVRTTLLLRLISALYVACSTRVFIRGENRPVNVLSVALKYPPIRTWAHLIFC